MIETLVINHGIDRRRIFITGLSAGGAMTSVMLATYPDIFAGGAIIAGLPYGCATTIPEAFDRMRGTVARRYGSSRIWCAVPRNMMDHGRPFRSGTETATILFLPPTWRRLSDSGAPFLVPPPEQPRRLTCRRNSLFLSEERN